MRPEAAHKALDAFAAIGTGPIGDIVLAIPGSASIFQRAGMDLSRVRGMSLEAWAGRDRIRSETIVERVRELVQAIEKAETEPDALIAYILIHFHDAHRDEIPELVDIANRVETHHRDHPAVPRGLALLLDRLDEFSEFHMQDEEPVLFSMMSRDRQAFLAPSVTEMVLDHGEQEALLADIRVLTADFRPPRDACALWRALYMRVHRLCVELADHSRLENDILFPCFLSRSAC